MENFREAWNGKSRSGPTTFTLFPRRTPTRSPPAQHSRGRACAPWAAARTFGVGRSEEHTSELQSHHDLVCRLLLEKKKKLSYSHINLNTLRLPSSCIPS